MIQQTGTISLDRPFVSVEASNSSRWAITAPGHETTANGAAPDAPHSQSEVRHGPALNGFRVCSKKPQGSDFS